MAFWWSRKETPETRDRLGTLSARLDDVESSVRKLRVEWQDVVDRLERIMGRMNKRAARQAQAEAEAEAEVEAPPSHPVDDEVTKRRTRLFGPGVGR